MRHVTVDARIDDVSADELFERVADFEGYARIAAGVRSVKTRDGADGAILSDWEVNFRNGILRWQEEDRVDRTSRTITFSQVRGDLAEFSGTWAVETSDSGARIRFDADFDLGMPSLATILDPVAERALRENVLELIMAFADAACAGALTVEEGAEVALVA